jgi:hypothetical protein
MTCIARYILDNMWWITHPKFPRQYQCITCIRPFKKRIQFKYKKRIFADPILVNKGAMRAAEVIKIGISISFELENWERENKLLNNDPQHLQYYQGSCQQLHAWSPNEWDFLSPSIPDIHAEIHGFYNMESDIITITIQLETKKKNNIVL